jgi:DNA-binding MarR family transcriptional regulator
MGKRLSDRDYSRLLALRTGLRRFERWSEVQARAAGLTPAQHQLLLAVRGHGDGPGPTVGEIADYLLLRHHSVVGLVDRAEAAGLVHRDRDLDDHRVVRVHLTGPGARRLEELSALHLEELDRLALDLPALWRGLGPAQRPHGLPGPPPAGDARTGYGRPHRPRAARARK